MLGGEVHGGPRLSGTGRHVEDHAARRHRQLRTGAAKGVPLMSEESIVSRNVGRCPTRRRRCRHALCAEELEHRRERVDAERGGRRLKRRERIYVAIEVKSGRKHFGLRSSQHVEDGLTEFDVRQVLVRCAGANDKLAQRFAVQQVLVELLE